MNIKKNLAIWLIWLAASLMGLGYWGWVLMYAEDKTPLSPGPMTHGHHQIELECTACHVSPFGGKEVLQDACTDCHAEELKEAQDSHPKSKFTDPRNVDRLEKIDARFCVGCHIEHKPEITKDMGVTLPDDFCVHCHADIGEDRPSHEGMGMETCASAGCHNFHDNRALYEDFLVKHHSVDPHLRLQQRLSKNFFSFYKKKTSLGNVLKISKPDMKVNSEAKYHESDWMKSAHAKANVNCTACHSDSKQENIFDRSIALKSCVDCHAEEVKGFEMGKHGMRMKLGMSPMSPAIARVPMHEDAKHLELTCNSCHEAHAFNTWKASTESCLGCHADDHSFAFKSSKHFNTLGKFQKGLISEEAVVTCATCHMPRVETDESLDGETRVLVQHNQNDNLRPNEKMIRPVCMNCHGLEFSIDALADENLIRNNFQGMPSTHIKSVDMALERDQAAGLQH